MADSTDDASIEALFAQGKALHQQGRIDAALAIYERVLGLQPGHVEALHYAGVVAYQSGRHEIALELIQAAIQGRPHNAAAYSNQGLVQEAQGKDDAALQSYAMAIACQPDSGEAHQNRGNLLRRLGRLEEALSSYSAALSVQPGCADAYYNCGLVLHDMRQYALALQCHDQAIALRPDYAKAHNARGNVMQAQGQLDEALLSYDRAISADPACADAYNNRGNVFYRRKQYPAALQDYERAIAIQPDLANLPGVRLFTKMKLCDWRGLEALRADLASRIRRGEAAVVPFVVVVGSDEPDLQKIAAENYVRIHHPQDMRLGFPDQPRLPGKIRLAYFSADFHDHATAYLIAELIERHDRQRFEVIAFSFGPDDGGEMRNRLRAAFDKFVDVSLLSDVQVAEQARALNVDIAIDLKGHTFNARTGIFACRAAPIQVSYLGFPGTMGAAYYDYLVADRTIIPDEMSVHYSEKIVRLPGSYQVNDRQRRIAETAPGRAEQGLPRTGFVFCCFNNSYKITPVHFDGWMRILKAVDGSVLWLLEDSADARRNLVREAEQRGVSATRIVFAQRIPLDEHLARHRCADLFLDSFPCNAHTTASDALWVGLPVLTCQGQSFASRVAASLLNAIGLPELIVRTQADYERQAIDLALSPHRLTTIRKKLADNRLSSSLFDTARFSAALECAYTLMFERCVAGLAPEHMRIEAEPTGY